jgi:hypothetical protein
MKLLVNRCTVLHHGARLSVLMRRRKNAVQLVKEWIEVAPNPGASVIRVFSGAALSLQLRPG